MTKFSIDSWPGRDRCDSVKGLVIIRSTRPEGHSRTGWQLRDDVHERLIEILGDYVLSWNDDDSTRWFITTSASMDKVLIAKLGL